MPTSSKLKTSHYESVRPIKTGL